jgi:hypothetical protein
MLFHERAKLAMEQLAKQQTISFEEALAQIKWLKEQSTVSEKKQRPKTAGETK